MISLFKRHKALAALAASALVLAGCAQDDSPALLSEGDVTLRLTLDTGQASADSRAQAPDDYENPSGEFEQIHTLRVIIVRHLDVDPATGMPLEGDAAKDAEVEYNKLVMTSPETGMPLRDNLEFKVHDNETKLIYLIANENSLPSPINDGESTPTAYLDELERGHQFNAAIFNSWTASMTGNFPVADGNMFAGSRAVPLTEFFRVEVTRNSPGRTDSDPTVRDGEAQSVHLFLTRAVSKVSFNIKVDDSYKASGSNITGIRFSGFNWTEYVFPHCAIYDPEKIAEDFPDYNTDGTVIQTERHITSFVSYRRTQQGGCSYDITGLNIPVARGTNAIVGPFYFPESCFESAGTFNVQVQLDGNDEWLSGTPTATNFLTIGGFPAVARNTHLKYTLTFGDTGLGWQAIEAPYNSVFLDPSFGL